MLCPWRGASTRAGGGGRRGGGGAPPPRRGAPLPPPPPANLPAGRQGVPEIALMAHLDTSDSAPGRDVRPIVHERYDGQPIQLQQDVVLDPAEFPTLESYVGRT